MYLYLNALYKTLLSLNRLFLMFSVCIMTAGYAGFHGFCLILRFSYLFFFVLYLTV